MLKRLGTFALLLSLLTLAANCGRFEAGTDGLYSQEYQSLTTLEDNYIATVYPIFRAQCASCHAVAQQPLFAINDFRASFRIVQQNNLVAANDPSTSTVVRTIRGGGHHGVKDFVADNLLAAISEYSYRLGQN